MRTLAPQISQVQELIRQRVLDEIPADSRSDLARADLHEVLVVYGTWQSRLIRPRPRQVHVSAELRARTLTGDHQEALEAIKTKIGPGEDLTPHLSRRVTVAYDGQADPRAKPSGRPDRDLLIAEWGIHHLHLSTTLEADGFVSRTDDLLFAAFAEDDAYLINVYPHGNWALKAMAEILVRTWPDSGVLLPSLSGLSLSQEYNDEDRLTLRNAGITTALEIDGTVYVGLGQTTAGTPMALTREADKVLWELRAWRESGPELLRQRLQPVFGRDGARAALKRTWRATTLHGEVGLASGDLFVRVWPFV